MANDFTGFDAVWLFDNNLNDSSGNNNTLTAYDTTTYSSTSPAPLEGSKSISLDGGDAFYRTDANLAPAGFPTKNGDAAKIISVALLFNTTSFPSAGNTVYLVAKYDTTGLRRSWAIGVKNDGGIYKAVTAVGKTDGTTSETYVVTPSNVTISSGNTYLIGLALRGAAADKDYTLTIVDCANTSLQDTVGPGDMANELGIFDAPLYIGSLSNNILYYTGLLDQVVITADYLTPTQFNYIAQGNFPDGPAVTGYGGMMF